jgi:hypothetical protein
MMLKFEDYSGGFHPANTQVMMENNEIEQTLFNFSQIKTQNTFLKSGVKGKMDFKKFLIVVE